MAHGDPCAQSGCLTRQPFLCGFYAPGTVLGVGMGKAVALDWQVCPCRGSVC